MRKRKHTETEEVPQIAFSTRSGPFHYTRQILQTYDMHLNAAQIASFMSKFESKQLNDKFLPFWNVTGLKNRIGFSPLQANTFVLAVRSLQREKAIPALKDLPKATEESFDAVVSAVSMMNPARGNMQHCIDEHLRHHGVWCNAATVSRRLKGLLPGKRSRILSSESTAMITDMMYCATASTNCKPAGTLRRLARACAMLDKRFNSYQAYLNRNRVVPELVEGSRSRSGISMLYESQSDSNPQHPAHSQRMSQPAESHVVVSSQSQTGLVLVAAYHADAGEGKLSSDFGGDGDDDDGGDEGEEFGDNGSSSTEGVPELFDEEDGEGGSSSDSDDGEASDSDGDEPLVQLDPLPWKGVPPSARTDFHMSNKLSMRYPRKSQLKKLMKECNCSLNIAQWTAKHRR
jgi:hypothetical protein